MHGLTVKISPQTKLSSFITDRLSSVLIAGFSCVHADAAYRFFRSRVEERSVSKRGLTSSKQKQKRRHERLTRVSRLVFLCGISVLFIIMFSLQWPSC